MSSCFHETLAPECCLCGEDKSRRKIGILRDLWDREIIWFCTHCFRILTGEDRRSRWEVLKSIAKAEIEMENLARELEAECGTTR